VSKSTVAYWLLIAAAGFIGYIIYAYRKLDKGPNLSDALGVVIAIVGLGGAARIYYLVFWEQPESIGVEDLVCLFIGALALTWCSVDGGLKSFRGEPR
jgi:hypothetical protein